MPTDQTPSPLAAEFAARLREARRTRHERLGGEPWSQTDLADAVGVHLNAVSAWETGRRMPRTAKQMMALESALGLTPGDLLLRPALPAMIAAADRGASTDAEHPSVQRQRSLLAAKFEVQAHAMGATERQIAAGRATLLSAGLRSALERGEDRRLRDEEFLEYVAEIQQVLLAGIAARADVTVAPDAAVQIAMPEAFRSLHELEVAAQEDLGRRSGSS